MVPALAAVLLAASPLIDPHPSYVEVPSSGTCPIELPPGVTVEFEADVPLEAAGASDPGHILVHADRAGREHAFYVRVTRDDVQITFWKQIILRASAHRRRGTCQVSQPTGRSFESTVKENDLRFTCKVTLRRGEATLEMQQGASCVLPVSGAKSISI